MNTDLQNLLQESRTPLTSIIGWVEMLLRFENGNVISDELNLRETLQTIQVGINDLHRLVEDIVKQETTLSFEMRTPVTAMNGWTELLLRFENNNRIDDEFNLRELLEIIQNNCTRLAQFITDIQSETHQQ